MSSWDECEVRLVGRNDVLEPFSCGFSWSIGDKTYDLKPEWRNDYLFVGFYVRFDPLPFVRMMSNERPEVYFELTVEYANGGWYGLALQAGKIVHRYVPDMLDEDDMPEDLEPEGIDSGLLATLEHDTLACQCEQCVGREESRKEWLPEEFASNMPEYIQDILVEREKGHIARRMKCRAKDQDMAKLRVAEFVRKHSQGAETAEMAETAVNAANGTHDSENGRESK